MFLISMIHCVQMGLYCRDVIKQYTASELLGSPYLNDTHKI